MTREGWPSCWIYVFSASRLTGVDGVGYTWDDRGNQTGNGTFTYTYDGAGRLVGVQGAGQTLAYTYDGDGLRVARTAAGQATAYAWDVAAALPQQLSDGGALYLPGVGRWDGQAWTYSLPDGLGSVRQLAGEQAHVLQRYDYSPFGRVVAAEGERENPLQYTGEHWDAGAGLLYLRARWYSPAIGRFLTRDPFPGLALLPQTQHDYVYVGNNPVNFTDPSGEFVFIPLLLVAAAGGTLGGLGYYAIQTALNPCVEWNWGEAAFWGGVGTGLGALLGTGIYGGWWVGLQLGWWGPAATTTLGGTIIRAIEIGKQEMARMTQGVDLSQAEVIVKRTWTSASAIYGQVNQAIINYYIDGQYVATIHRVETLTGEAVHIDFKAVVIEGIKYLVR